MSSSEGLQALLRFLSQEAKLPLATAMSKVKALQSANMNSPTAISSSNLQSLKEIFADEKIAKQVLNAAKRASKKRSLGDAASAQPAKKKTKGGAGPAGSISDPVAFESSLALPGCNLSEDELAKTVIFTNRAPLVLAFAVMLLKYTMPEQPLSSRLSLAQAVVSVNSRSKAVSLGLETGKSAEEEGWGEGQPTVRVMGRDIKVMKRWGYDPNASGKDDTTEEIVGADVSSIGMNSISNEQPALWGIDLEALKKTKGPLASRPSTGDQLPIYAPQSARAYLLKSFQNAPVANQDTESRPKDSSSEKTAAKEHNLGALLLVLDLLYHSWASVLEKQELDRRAWGWYVRVRPEVENGVAGWGGKGEVNLAQILKLRRSAEKVS